MKVSDRHPFPWRVEHEEPYEASIVDANGKKIGGVSLWLDDALPSYVADTNDQHLANAKFIVDAVNLAWSAFKGTK